MNQIYLFGRAISLPDGLDDHSEYIFDSGDDLMAMEFEGPSRGESLNDRVKKLRARLQDYLSESICFVQDESAEVGGHAARILTYEGIEGSKSIQVRHLFMDTQRPVEPWAQMRYRCSERSWAEIDRRFSLPSLNLELGSASKPASEGSSRHRVRELVFDLPHEMREETLYELCPKTDDFKILLFRENQQPIKPELDPEVLQIETPGSSCKRIDPPVSIDQGFARLGPWFHSSFPSDPPRYGFHYGERVEVPDWAPEIDSLVLSATSYEESQVEPMARAIAEITRELKNVRR